MKQLHSPATIAVAALLSVATTSCAEEPTTRAAVSHLGAPGGAEIDICDLVDAPLEEYRKDLLAMAYGAASKLPLHPHVKNRSRMQEAVTEACLELGQAARALQYAEGIENWRRGTAYANLALQQVRGGERRDVHDFLDLASEVADSIDPVEDQAWRRDRVRAQVARVHIWLGEDERASAIAAGLASSEAGVVSEARAALLDADSFERELEVVRTIASKGDFDQLRGALGACARLFERFYDDVERRTKVEEAMERSWTRLPSQVRIELLIDMGESALANHDPEKALALADEGRAQLESTKLTPDAHIPTVARLAELRYLAGGTVVARADLDAALALYDAQRERIVNMYRGGVLRPLAEAYHVTGDRDAALALYTRALEEGVENPNSRPRAGDLSATCVSMAVHGVEPNEHIRARIGQIFERLGDPW